MLEATNKKLREAGFFLEKLAAQERDILRAEPEARDFYLSAFLASARSVGDVICAEQGDHYRQWFAQRKQTLVADEEKILKVTNAQRIATIHIRGPAIKNRSKTVPLYELQAEMQRKGGDLQYSHLPGTPAPTTERTWLAFADYPTENTVDVCGRYMNLMIRLLSEYESTIAA